MEAINNDELFEKVKELTKEIVELRKVIEAKENEFLTVDEAAKFLRLCKHSVYNKVGKRELPYIKRGKLLYFSRKDLEEYLLSGHVKTMEDIKNEHV